MLASVSIREEKNSVRFVFLAHPVPSTLFLKSEALMKFYISLSLFEGEEYRRSYFIIRSLPLRAGKVAVKPF